MAEETKTAKPERVISPQKALDQALYELLMTEPFYSYVIVQFRKRWTRKVPIAGVALNGGGIDLWLNPDTFPKFKVSSRVGILKHEIHHVIFQHMSRMEGRDPRAWNIATDAAINCNLTGLPSKEEFSQVMGFEGDLIYPKTFNWPDGLLAEEYYDKIPVKHIPALTLGSGQDEGIGSRAGSGDQNDKNGQQSNGDGSGGPEEDDDGNGQSGTGSNPKDENGNYYDAHIGWGLSDGMSPEMAEEVVRQIVKQAAKKSRGEVPGGLEQAVEALLRSKVNWRTVLRHFVAKARRANRQYTWKRPSRRWPDAQGTRKDRVLNLAVAIDTSGSISDEELSLFFGEIERISLVGKNKITIIECDAEVQQTWEYKRGVALPKVKGRGGTDFRPVFDWIKKQREKFDACIYLTDSYGPAPEKQPLPTLWAITEAGWDNADRFCSWGMKIKLEVDEK